MSALVGVALALVAVAIALRTARAQGVAAWPLLGWSLLLAVIVSAISVVGSLVAIKLAARPAVELAVLFSSIVAAIAVGVWLSRRIWRHLQPPRPRS